MHLFDLVHGVGFRLAEVLGSYLVMVVLGVPSNSSILCPNLNGNHFHTIALTLLSAIVQSTFS